MSTLNFKRFSDVDALKHVGRKYLLKLLDPHRAVLAVKGCVLPPLDDDSVAIDFDALSKALVTPDDTTPRELSEALYYVSEMASDEGMNSLLDAVEARNKEIGATPIVMDVADEDPAAADVAVQVWLQDRVLLQEVHDEAYLDSGRSFVAFTTDVNPVPPFTMPDEVTKKVMQDSMDDWFAKKKRGKGCKVSPHMRGHECWVLVRHGMPMKREGALKAGHPEDVFYRPQRHDVVIYDTITGALRVHAKTKGERGLYCWVFGLHLFGKADFFSGEEKYTLAPLLSDAGADCLKSKEKIAGVELVTLVEMEIDYGKGENWERVVRRSNDLFVTYERRKRTWPQLDSIRRVVFSVLFTGADKARTVTIRPANKITYQRIDDAEVFEPWLEKQEFTLGGGEDEEDETVVGQS